LISARGLAGHALLIDCRSLDVVPVRLPDNVAVLVVHSGVERGLVASEYNLRRRQCEAVARHCKVPALRDLDLSALRAAEAVLQAAPESQPGTQPTPVEWRRARHVVTENARTLAAANALAAGNLVDTGKLMAESHASMRDDFEITVPAIDSLVDILSAAIGPTGGARMTGGGFGGCVVALLPLAHMPRAIDAVKRRYRSPRGEPAEIHVCQPSAGAGSV
jgi:galactokinase